MLPLPGIELTGKSRFSQTFPIAFGSLFNKTLLSASRPLLAEFVNTLGQSGLLSQSFASIRSGFYQIKFYGLIAGRTINLQLPSQG